MHYDEGSTRRRRRRHSEQFKAVAIAACRRPGVSIAAAALERSINANLLRRWVIEAERAEGDDRGAEESSIRRAAGFVSLPLPVAAPTVSGAPIHIELRRGAMTIVVQWPPSALHECALWLREILK